MDLEYGSQYEEYKKEVQIFCKKYNGVHFSDAAKTPMATDNNSAGPVVTRSEWQKILIENGYFARSIPKEYGGFGGDSDVIKNRITATEFSNAGIPAAMGGQGIDMLVPTLLELGTEEQKK
jgi:alkylation response protein AidB-like acyl-CoA dehydrogenase